MEKRKVENTYLVAGNDQLAEEDDRRRSRKGDAADCKDKSAAVERRGKERREQIGHGEERTEESKARARARRRGDSERAEVESESTARHRREEEVETWSRELEIENTKKTPRLFGSVQLLVHPVQTRTGPKTENKKQEDRGPDRKASVRSGPGRSGPVFGSVRSWTI